MDAMTLGQWLIDEAQRLADLGLAHAAGTLLVIRTEVFGKGIDRLDTVARIHEASSLLLIKRYEEDSHALFLTAERLNRASHNDVLENIRLTLRKG